MERKKCKECGAMRDLDEFYPHHHMKDNRRSECKICIREDRREKYYREKEKNKAEYRDFVEQNMEGE